MLNRFPLLLLLLVGLFLTTASAQGTALAASQKLSELRFKASESSSGVIRLNEEEYFRYLYSQPRPYDAIVLLSISTPNCRMCPAYEDGLDRTSWSFRQSGVGVIDSNVNINEYTNNLLSATSSASGLSSSFPRPIFFFTVDISLQENRNVARFHALSAVPVLYYSPSDTAVINDRHSAVFPVPLRLTALGIEGQHRSEILRFANQRLLEDVQAQFTVVERVRVFITLLGFVGGAFVVLALFVLLVNKVPLIMPIGAVIIQGLSSSGLAHSLSQKLPWWGQNGQNTVYFAPGHRAQFLGEGLMMGNSFVVAGMLILLSVACLTNQRLRKILGRSQSLISLITFIASLSVIYFIYFAYREKVHWYGPSMWPLNESTPGPLRGDRGNDY